MNFEQLAKKNLVNGYFREYVSTFSYLTRLLDVLSVICGGYIAYFLKFGMNTVVFHYQAAIFVASLFTLIVFPLTGIYRSFRGRTWLQQVQKLSVAWLYVIALLITTVFFTKSSGSYSREWMAVWVLLTIGMISLYRCAICYLLWVLHKKGIGKKKLIIVGAGKLGRHIYTTLKNQKISDFDVLGFLDDAPELRHKEIDGLPCLGGIDEINQIATNYQADEVIIALPLKCTQRVKDILYLLRHSTTTIRFVPNVFEFPLTNYSVTRVAGLHVYNLSETPLYGIRIHIKALEDKLLSFLILLGLSPLFLLIATAVKLSSPGPVFYKQQRVSWNGVCFDMLKFRSMPVDAEKNSGPQWARKNENRATRVGGFLRKTSLDELPQFINVLKGDMSIVGPRPERPVFVEKFKRKIPKYMQKHLVKAGITGWAQIHGWRGDTCLEKRIEHDLHYIENWSLLLDIKIIFLTVFKGFIHEHAY
ncbi:MAG: undecaprenyl-phosphate glucose phosphotransferase [Candidatus Polarisedimenticolaceae bacterium]|nr:undecaprenyl-phosphate glucose phosphotransferase [Candidatus Polarisedimenticolaceae bacterium]